MTNEPYEDKPEEYKFGSEETEEEFEQLEELSEDSELIEEYEEDEMLMVGDEDNTPDEKPTRPQFKKKGISKAKYNLLFYGSIIITLFVIAVIAIDLAIGINIVRATIFWDWSTSKKEEVEKPIKKGKIEKKQPSKYQVATNYAKHTIELYDSAVELRGDRKINDIPKEEVGEVRSKYNKMIHYYYMTQELWYELIVSVLNEKGIEGDLVSNKEDELTQKMEKLEEIIKIVKNDEELSYLFTNKTYQGKENTIIQLKRTYNDVYNRLRPMTLDEELDEIGQKVESLDGKRFEFIGTLNDSCFKLEELKKDAPEYEEEKAKVIEAANNYYLHLWKTLYMYYKYVKFAKDNELELNPTVVNIKNKVETSSFPYIESKLKDLGIEVDRNTEFAKEVRDMTEELQNEVGNYGMEDEEDDDEDSETDRSYADDDEDE